VFDGAGKTDILLRYNDRNAFIGECKIWHGERHFSEAIGQLLSCTVWRDTKAALIPFIRQGDATAIIDMADAATKAHPAFMSPRAVQTPDSRRDYVMHSTQDPNRQIQVALLPVVLTPTT
jgi:hypothetical protein